MTKKRIADLLKEEVEKAAEPTKAADTPEATPKPSARTGRASAAAKTTPRKTTRRSAAKTTAAAAHTAQSPAENETDATATLKTQITDLESALKAAQAQVAGLQSDIETHQNRIYELKDSLETTQRDLAIKDQQLQKTTQALEEAKTTIRQLTELKAAAAPEPPAKPAHIVHGPDLATSRHTLSRQQPGRTKAIPDYAIQRGEQNSMLSDEEIGWVD
jgi:chromosome segregation ATPase